MDQQDNWERLQAFVEEIRQDKGIPGMVVGLWHKGEEQIAGFGITNVDHPLPVTPGTLFQIGSITKTFTATAVMRLVNEGKLDLDAPIRTYLPDFQVADPDASAQATTRHLLTHTGGWTGDYFPASDPGHDALSKYMGAMTELEQLAPVGTHFSYSNSGFVLAGHIVEAVSGKPFREAIRELVLDPLQLADTYFDAGEVIIHRFAVGHYEQNNTIKVAGPWPLPRYADPAGAITCSAADLLQYARFHLGGGTNADGTRLLPADLLAEMQTPHVAVWESEARGLGWHINDGHGTRLLEHGGGTNGQISWLMLAPAHDLALAVFTNMGGASPVVAAIRRRVLREYLDIDAALPERAEADEAELASFTGKYARAMMEVELGMLGGRLTAQVTYKSSFATTEGEAPPPPPPPPPVSLDLCTPDRLLVLNGTMKDSLVDVVRRPDGSIGWLRIGSRLHVRQS